MEPENMMQLRQRTKRRHSQSLSVHSVYSDIDMISSLCILMARGALISMLVVVFILPSMFMIFDKVIVKTSKNFLPQKAEVK